MSAQGHPGQARLKSCDSGRNGHQMATRWPQLPVGAAVGESQVIENLAPLNEHRFCVQKLQDRARAARCDRADRTRDARQDRWWRLTLIAGAAPVSPRASSAASRRPSPRIDRRAWRSVSPTRRLELSDPWGSCGTSWMVRRSATLRSRTRRASEEPQPSPCPHWARGVPAGGGQRWSCPRPMPRRAPRTRRFDVAIEPVNHPLMRAPAPESGRESAGGERRLAARVWVAVVCRPRTKPVAGGDQLPLVLVARLGEAGDRIALLDDLAAAQHQEAVRRAGDRDESWETMTSVMPRSSASRACSVDPGNRDSLRHDVVITVLVSQHDDAEVRQMRRRQVDQLLHVHGSPPRSVLTHVTGLQPSILCHLDSTRACTSAPANRHRTVGTLDGQRYSRGAT